MKAEPLLSLAATIASEQTVECVLQTIVQGCAAQPGVALVRIWLLRPGDICERCYMKAECADQTNCFHLAASAGTPTHSPGEDWSFLNGQFRRVPINARKVGKVGGLGQAMLIENVVLQSEQIARPDWAKREAISSFAGYPLVSAGRTLGVLAVFTRIALDAQAFTWLRLFADQAANAISNAQALEAQNQTNEQLKESKEELRQLIEGIPQLLWRASSDGEADYHNQRLLEYHGRPIEEVRGFGFLSIVHSDDRERLSKTWRESVSSGEPFEVESRLLGANGHYRWFLVRGLPFRDARGVILRWYGSCTDIETRKQTEQALELENAYLQEQVQEEFSEMVGSSPALKRALHQIQMVAPTDTTVLISGESGTGKELAARAIHRSSRRNRTPLVTVNCASIPRELFESEFFGHAKGAFTGALRDRIGRFQMADKGTIFFDEVGEIPIELQSKLLRVLQEGEIERIGEDRTRRVDVRVLAATNKDLVQEIYAGRFREDLYYRLCVFPIHLPPLRDRREDIPLLAGHLLKIGCRRLNLPEARMTGEAVELLSAYNWPGNIRELQNVIERGAILSQGGPLRVDLVLADPRSSPFTNRLKRIEKSNESDSRPASRQAVFSKDEMERRERENTIAALNKSNWKIYGPGGAAEILGIKPTTLSSKIKKMGLKRSAS